MKNPATKKPLSARKRAAILKNLEKAQAAERTPASYARSRHNATKHGLFVRRLEDSFRRLREKPREFQNLHALLEEAFVPSDETEATLVRRLAEAVWRHLRVYRAAARWELETLASTLKPLSRQPRLGPILTRARATQVMVALLDEERLWKRTRLALGEVERMLRLLLIQRTGDPDAKFHFIGRQFTSELLELSPDPSDWARRYAAAVPLR